MVLTRNANLLTLARDPKLRQRYVVCSSRAHVEGGHLVSFPDSQAVYATTRPSPPSQPLFQASSPKNGRGLGTRLLPSPFSLGDPEGLQWKGTGIEASSFSFLSGGTHEGLGLGTRLLPSEGLAGKSLVIIYTLAFLDHSIFTIKHTQYCHHC